MATARVAPAAPSTGVSRGTMPRRLPPGRRRLSGQPPGGGRVPPAEPGSSTRSEAALKLTTRIVATIAALALSAAPALAKPPHPTPGPKAGSHAKANAYGKFCRGESKKHVKGQKGTPFSQCVTAMAKLASGKAATPRAACKGLSHKHVEGQKGTPFSLCVSGGAKLLRERA